MIAARRVRVFWQLVCRNKLAVGGDVLERFGLLRPFWLGLELRVLFFSFRFKALPQFGVFLLVHVFGAFFRRINVRT
jgi:hypothetical protein